MQSYIKIWHKQLNSYRNWEYDSVSKSSYHVGLGMKYFLVTTNRQSVADAAHRPFKCHDGLTDEQDKYPNLATSHTEQTFDLHLCCDFNRPKADKWPVWDVLFCFSGFLLTHNTIADPATLRRIVRSLRPYSSDDRWMYFYEIWYWRIVRTLV